MSGAAYGKARREGRLGSQRIAPATNVNGNKICGVLPFSFTAKLELKGPTDIYIAFTSVIHTRNSWYCPRAAKVNLLAAYTSNQPF